MACARSRHAIAACTWRLDRHTQKRFKCVVATAGWAHSHYFPYAYDACLWLMQALQLLLRYGASPFTSVKRGIFKGRLAIDFAITAKSKESTSLLLEAMQQPQGWPVAGIVPLNPRFSMQRTKLISLCRHAKVDRKGRRVVHEVFSSCLSQGAQIRHGTIGGARVA